MGKSKNITTILLSVCFSVACIAAFLFPFAFAHSLMPDNRDATSDIYPMSMVVTVVNQEEDFVVIRDFNGQNWMFNGAEDWAVNDICACIMDTNGTDAIYDDIIVETRYCGWVGDKSAV